MIVLLLKGEDYSALGTRSLVEVIHDHITKVGFNEVMFKDPTRLPKTLFEARGKAVIIGVGI